MSQHGIGTGNSRVGPINEALACIALAGGVPSNYILPTFAAITVGHLAIVLALYGISKVRLAGAARLAPRAIWLAC